MRLRGVAKWLLLIACVIEFFACSFYQDQQVQYARGGNYAKLYGGSIILGRYSGRFGRFAPNGWFTGRAFPSPKWLPSISDSAPGDWSLSIPLSNVLQLTGILAAVAWRLDRNRPTPAHVCVCGYNLTGN